MSMELREVMTPGRVVESAGEGYVIAHSENVAWMFRRRLYDYLDDTGSSHDHFDPLPKGWELLSGWSNQYRYNGPVMHSSEYIGAGLEDHIRETAGLYVVLSVVGVHTDDCECGRDQYHSTQPGEWPEETDVYGWAIAYRPNE